MILDFKNLKIMNGILDLGISDSSIKEMEYIRNKYANINENFTNTYGVGDLQVRYTISYETYNLSMILGQDKAQISYKVASNKKKEKWFSIMNYNYVIVSKKTMPSKSEIEYICKAYNNKLIDLGFKYENIDQLKKHIESNIFKKGDSLRKIDFDEAYYLDFISTIEETLGIKFLSEDKIEQKMKKFADRKLKWDVGQFLDVQTFNNHRLAILYYFKKYSGGYYNSGSGYYRRTLWVLGPTDTHYNYVDIDTFYKYSGTPLHFMQDVKELPQEDGVIKYYLKRDIDDGHDLDRQPFHLVGEKMLTRAIKRYHSNKKAKESSEKLEKTKIKKLSKKLENLDKTPIKLNGAIFKKHSIEYEGQILQSSDISVGHLINSYVTGNRKLEDLNFDIGFESFINRLVNTLMRDPNSTLKATIGEIDVKLNYKYSVSDKGKASAYYTINDIRINKDEFQKVLSRGLCFQSVEDFNKYLKQVSTCSLKIHKYLHEGLKLNVKDPLNGDKIKFKISLKRINGRQYIKVGKKTYLVRNTPKLLKIVYERNLLSVLELLSNNEVVEIDDPMVLKNLVIEGRQTLKDAIEKSKKLLEKTITYLKLEEKTATTPNGDSISGFIVHGTKDTYLVENDIGEGGKGKCAVYRYPSMRYICIVDKSPNQQVGVDNMVNRLYALKNDSVLAKEIYTL